MSEKKLLPPPAPHFWDLLQLKPEMKGWNTVRRWGWDCWIQGWDCGSQGWLDKLFTPPAAAAGSPPVRPRSISCSKHLNTCVISHTLLPLPPAKIAEDMTGGYMLGRTPSLPLMPTTISSLSLNIVLLPGLYFHELSPNSTFSVEYDFKH